MATDDDRPTEQHAWIAPHPVGAMPQGACHVRSETVLPAQPQAKKTMATAMPIPTGSRGHKTGHASFIGSWPEWLSLEVNAAGQSSKRR